MIYIVLSVVILYGFLPLILSAVYRVAYWEGYVDGYFDGKGIDT